MTAVPAERSAADCLTSATDRLGRAAEGEDIPGNLEAGLRAILAAHEARGPGALAPNDVALAVHACLAAIDPASRHFGQKPLPSTFDFGLRSAGSLVQTLGLPVAAICGATREFHIPAYVDGTGILLAEVDAAMRWKRIVERSEAAGAAVSAQVIRTLAGRKPVLKLVGS